MITLHRSASIIPGHVASAIGFAKEVAALIKARTGTEVAVALPVAGNPNRVSWTAHFESLADFERTMDRLRLDAPYGELVAKGGMNFIPGTVFDELWRSI
ncbi:MAG: hypothetical protein IT500_14170 [Rubrivivax sp.]|nr:hypothetical protein [Rubrivivax sp.]